MARVDGTLVGAPEQLPEFVHGYAARVHLRRGSEERTVQVLASATDFHHIGTAGRETDRQVWEVLAGRIADHVARTYPGLDAVPDPLRLALVLGV